MLCGIVTTDARGMVAFVNEAALSLLAKSQPDLIGKHWTAILDSIRIPYREDLIFAMRSAQLAPEHGESTFEGVSRTTHGKAGVSWVVSRVEGIAPTNNAVERALRHAVIWRRISGGTDSAQGSRFVERMLTVVATCRQQGRNVLEYMTPCFEADRRGQAIATLLPVVVRSHLYRLWAAHGVE